MPTARIMRWRRDPAIARCAPFGLFIGMLVLVSVLPASGEEGRASAAAQWLVAGRGVLVALALWWFWPAYTELRRAGAWRRMDWLLAAGVGVGVFLVWIGLDQDWAVLSRSAGFVPHDPGGSMIWPLALARLAGFALVVPLMEELFWRSFLLRWLARHDFMEVEPRRVGAKAFVITTALFALEHDRWLAGAVAGAAYNWLYMRSGNLWVPIAAHALTNAVLGVWILSTGNWQFW